MAEIYWIQVVGSLGCLAVVAMIIAIIALIVLTISYYSFVVYDDDDRAKQASIVKWLKRSAVAVIVSAVGIVFIPDDKEMMAIYGLGSTIDYIKSSDKAKQLPDKAVDALTRYLDEVGNDKKDSK